MSRFDDARGIFTSTLSPGEQVVAGMTGLEPVSQVMGSSIFHVGFANAVRGWGGGELVNLTHAYGSARSNALARMQEEARRVGAHVVVDVRFEGRGPRWGEDLVEFTAVGTAVRLRGQPPAPQPALTLLKTDELWKLHHAGYWPAAIAMGNCFWYEPHADCASEGSWLSQELPAHSNAAVTARALAVERFRAFADHFGAHGVVGVRVSRHGRDVEYEVNDRSHTAFHLEMMLMGTAVVRRSDAGEPPRPQLVIDLFDRPRRASQ